jgi:hypothetical protein
MMVAPVICKQCIQFREEKSVLWIRNRISKDPKLFAGSGSGTRGYGSGSGSGTGLKPHQNTYRVKKNISNLIIMTLKNINLTFFIEKDALKCYLKKPLKSLAL